MVPKEFSLRLNLANYGAGFKEFEERLKAAAKAQIGISSRMYFDATESRRADPRLASKLYLKDWVRRTLRCLECVTDILAIRLDWDVESGSGGSIDV